MADAPFNIAETSPLNSDFVSIFPETEQSFRDIVESWLLIEHDTYGHHKLSVDSTTNRDTDTNWPAGALFFNSTLHCLQLVKSVPASPEWHAIGIPGATTTIFEQSTAPVSWTKLTDSGYNNVAIRGVNGTTSSGGSADFTDVFTARIIAQANLPNVNFTLSLSTTSDHQHSYITGTSSTTVGGAAGGNQVERPNTTRTTSTDGAHTHTGTAASGGSGTALDFAVKYRDVIFATKDTPTYT